MANRETETERLLKRIARLHCDRPSIAWEARDDGGGVWVARMSNGDDVNCNDFTGAVRRIRDEDPGFRER